MFAALHRNRKRLKNDLSSHGITVGIDDKGVFPFRVVLSSEFDAFVLV